MMPAIPRLRVEDLGYRVEDKVAGLELPTTLTTLPTSIARPRYPAPSTRNPQPFSPKL